MSKELTPLKAFKRFRNNIQWIEENIANLKMYFEDDELHFKEDLDTIETALKDYVPIRKLLDKHSIYDLWSLECVLHDIKALDIIKENVLINVIEMQGQYFIKLGIGENVIPITKEKALILKEALL